VVHERGLAVVDVGDDGHVADSVSGDHGRGKRRVSYTRCVEPARENPGNVPAGGRMESVKGLHHVALRCSDLEKCVDFYRRAVGLEVLRRWPAEGGGDRSVWLSTGQGFLALERASAPGAAAGALDDAPAGWQVVALAIVRADRKAWEDRLAANEVAVAWRSPFSIFFRDPEGNAVALSHWPEEA
jgi:catechol 2,3-dioxygenase-like lactoylglutathione lyase family enzyme